LEEGGYVTDVYSPDPHWRPQFVGLAQKGREIVTGWPSGPADALLSALVSEVDRGIEEAHTEDERSRLRRFREFLLGAGRDVVVGVLTRYADRATGSLG
jgi:hypothetical protein